MPSDPHDQSIKYQIQKSFQPNIAPLSIAIGGVLATGALQAATITVDTLDDGLIPGQCTLRAALFASRYNTSTKGCSAGIYGLDTIEFSDELVGTIQLNTGEDAFYDGSTLPIGESVIIDGGGRITVRGSGEAPVFYAQYYSALAEDIVFRGLTITGGGGERGGGIVSQAPYVVIENSIITANTARQAGGGIWQGGTADFVPTLQVIDSEISDNVLTSADGIGGGIYTNTRLAIFQSTISGNEAPQSGGGIAHYSEFPFSSKNSVFENNVTSTSGGGAISLLTSDPLLFTFISEDDLFTGNYAGSDGGAVAIIDETPISLASQYDGGIRVYGSLFEQNTAANGRAGGLYVRRSDSVGSLDELSNQVRVVGSFDYATPTTFRDNRASLGGGALDFSLGESIHAYISETVFENNQLVGQFGYGGAGILAINGGVTLKDSVFSGNSAEGAVSGRGGLLIALQSGSSLDASGIFFENNHSSGSGGGMGVISEGGGQVRIRESRFESNVAEDGRGGGLLVRGSGATIDLDRLIFRGNTAGEPGGGLAARSFSVMSSIAVRNSEFSNNQAAERGGGADFQLAVESSLSLVNSTVSGNESGRGGGVHVSGEGVLNVKYSTVANNTADFEGGGLMTDLIGTCNLRAALFDLNTAGTTAAAQDLRVATGSDFCTVRNTLLGGNASEFSDGGGNIIGQPSLIDALADNGGTGGKTHALPSNSPAIDAAGNSSPSTPDRDQRGFGFPREFGDEIDMGAFEFNTIVDEIFGDRFENP